MSLIQNVEKPGRRKDAGRAFFCGRCYFFSCIRTVFDAEERMPLAYTPVS
jgi:hypothetical protein